ncbi:hypothetical protein SOCE26_066630 [Sorangium cellulosum]|uniref:STAS/SEC14 domain-containing protein n=1 Tax=Sorangium cellulosum TaxID=56 RepID=A0A2L0F0T1_SORCE|nr:hypothetical protein [Sorangium cellulosum]AUX45182.1 hypothetical protein SOCE26_066630 [Sorangium cellulosum]
MIHFDERWVTISWDADIQAVLAEWKGFADTRELRAALEATLDLVRKKKATRCLADCRHAGPTTQDDQRWALENWLPRTAALGVRHVAYVMPRSAIARMSLTRSVTRFDGQDLAQVLFDDIDAARAWLAAAR